jgi:hypothetical protein
MAHDVLSVFHPRNNVISGLPARPEPITPHHHPVENTIYENNSDHTSKTANNRRGWPLPMVGVHKRLPARIIPLHQLTATVTIDLNP